MLNQRITLRLPGGLFLRDKPSDITSGKSMSPKRACAEREAFIGPTPHTATNSASGAHTCICASRRPMYEQTGCHILIGGWWVERSKAFYNVDCETMRIKHTY